LDEPAGDPEEGRLARAVLAHQRVDLAGPAVEVDAAQRLDRAEPAGDPPHLEDDRGCGRDSLRGGRRRPLLGIGHPQASAYIRARTAAGTSEGPETVGVTRSGSQSASVTSRMTCGTTISAGMSAPCRCIIPAVTAVRDWKVPPAEYQIW